jgi:hypothetical protein
MIGIYFEDLDRWALFEIDPKTIEWSDSVVERRKGIAKPVDPSRNTIAGLAYAPMSAVRIGYVVFHGIARTLDLALVTLDQMMLSWTDERTAEINNKRSQQFELLRKLGNPPWDTLSLGGVKPGEDFESGLFTPTVMVNRRGEDTNFFLPLDTPVRLLIPF